MGALSGNSVLPLNINNPAILISCVGLSLPPPPKKKKKKKGILPDTSHGCDASCGPTTAVALPGAGTKQKTISAEDKE